MSLAPLNSLTVRECWACLAAAPVGRLLYTERALPAIRPVNFSLRDGHVVIWSRPGGKATALRHQTAAFQVDQIDAGTGIGHSVVVTGRVSIVSDENESLSQVEPGRRPWPTGYLDHVIRIRVQRITGQLLNVGAGGARTHHNPGPWIAAAAGRTQLVALDPPSCWARMSAAVVGRLVYTERALPAIGLVHFTMDGEQILARPVSGSAVDVAHDDVVAFEVDEIDPRDHTGWSVVALGGAEIATDTFAGPAQVNPGYPDAGDPVDRLIRVRVEQITGRQVRLASGTGDGVAVLLR